MPQFRAPPRIVVIGSTAALLLTLPAASQQLKRPPTQVWMDVATFDTAGMPRIGGMGRAAMGLLGGAGENTFGATRFGGMPGQYLDIAMLNQLNPGVEAEQLIPQGLKLGKSLPLLPPKAQQKPVRHDRLDETSPMQDGKTRILIYWGCGTEVRPGQPREVRIDAKNGQVQVSGAMQGRYAPDRTVDPTPSHVLWPNDRHRKYVPDGASLVGAHQIVGAKVPESLKFALAEQHDFLPKIALSSSGDSTVGQTWSWRPVTRARGYFLNAMGSKGDALVLWSSSETPDAGMGVFDYLPPATVERWIREKVLLAPSVTSCAMPRGIFASTENGGGGMMRMIAFGPESHITWPPKPSDPKAAWSPEWNVRVRTKSTTTAMLGMPMQAAENNQNGTPADEQPAPSGKKKALKLLRGVLGR